MKINIDIRTRRKLVKLLISEKPMMVSEVAKKLGITSHTAYRDLDAVGTVIENRGNGAVYSV